MNKEKKFCSAVVVAAGKGTRFGTQRPKQFEMLMGKPVLYYTLKALCDCDIIDEIILVTSEDMIEFCDEEIVRKYGLEKVEAIVVGGKERYESVMAGLMGVDISADYVFIQDGARPLINDKIIRDGFETVVKYGTAVAAIPTTDTVKVTDNDNVVISTPDRRNTWRIQTPQIFEYKLILNAYFSLTEEDKDGITDDAMVIEKKTDVPVHLYMASEDNIKITKPDDLKLAEDILGKR